MRINNILLRVMSNVQSYTGNVGIAYVQHHPNGG